MKTYKTKKGTLIPLLNLKGKEYMQVAHRFILLTEENESYTIDTEFLALTDEQTIARSTVVILNKEGQVVRRAAATKRETKKDFSDHTEKAETGSIGRALAMLGMGTQHALADMDEGTRLADSPVVDPGPSQAVVPVGATLAEPSVEAPKATATFRKPPKKTEESKAVASNDSWE